MPNSSKSCLIYAHTPAIKQNWSIVSQPHWTPQGSRDHCSTTPCIHITTIVTANATITTFTTTNTINNNFWGSIYACNCSHRLGVEKAAAINRSTSWYPFCRSHLCPVEIQRQLFLSSTTNSASGAAFVSNIFFSIMGVTLSVIFVWKVVGLRFVQEKGCVYVDFGNR